MKRTHHCGELRTEHIGQEVVLNGWVQRSRDHGGVIFIDLRDRSGLVQLVFNPEIQPEPHKMAEEAKNEYVLAIKGPVRHRPEGTENPNLATGEVEVVAEQVEVLNVAKTPPFMIGDEEPDEQVRLRYRYLDLRRPRMAKILELRHRMTSAVREFFNSEGFYEIETPMLWKSTPEGAREFLVPARLVPGTFFVLPQSPQLCKQLLMVAGVERYYQIARCFRDEDSRADRQPEFTQIDVEMSFVDQDDVLSTVERMCAHVMKIATGVDLPLPFPRYTYAEAMARWGSDKPDTRFGMELVDIGDLVADSGFKVFRNALESGGQVKAINAPGCGDYSRKEIDDLIDLSKRFGAKGLASWILGEGEIKSQVAKFLTEEQMQAIFNRVGATTGDLVLAVADKPGIVAEALNRIRLEMGGRLNMIPEGVWDFHWVVDFPLFGWNEKESRYDPMHHPFCAPNPEDIDLLRQGYDTTAEPGHPGHPWGKVRASLYDLVLNGYELGGGSIRTHRRDLQELVFGAIGLDFEHAKERFGFLLEAFEYGAPPHGGIACGLDRFVAILSGCDSIRDVIAFPKTATFTCPLSGAPTPVEEAALKDLHLRSLVEH
ncbi:MAG: aspartate--tRNA ligase [Armatimonadetes bacterium]|nr:aspartate--tRNA ligase [Armatimonadota bacterium]